MITEVPSDARLEIKYVGRDLHLPELLHWLRMNGAGFRTAFANRRVNSLYFETDAYESWASSLEGSLSRWKVRYRWYGDSPRPAPGHLEIKRKRNVFGWKERHPIESLDGADGDTWASFRERLRSQISSEGRRWLEAHPLPAIMNAYDRRYFVTPDSRIRVTVDTGHEAWDQRFGPGPSRIRRLGLPGLLVVEFKFAREDRARASEAMQGIPFHPSAHSKYATALRATDP